MPDLEYGTVHGSFLAVARREPLSLLLSFPPFPGPFDFPVDNFCLVSVICNSAWPYFKRGFVFTGLQKLTLCRVKAGWYGYQLQDVIQEIPLTSLQEIIFSSLKCHYPLFLPVS